MSLLNTMNETISAFMALAGTSLIVALVLWIAHRLLIVNHSAEGNERLFSKQLIMLGLTVTGVLAIALALPVEESSRNQIIALIGLVISGILAFSSSTIFANLMAGIMMRVTKPFRTGDFISVKEYFGRVVERGLLDTEIQTEHRELVALPNTFMITNPVSVINTSGTIISTTLSLGYDIHHAKVEALLLDAAKQCGLEEAFVQILELGNYSITYKISGMLTEVKSLLTARSNIRRFVLDTLHDDGIEIMSPSFMSRRTLPENLKVIPARVRQQAADNNSLAEDLVFDKAEQAEQFENDQQNLLDKIQQCKIDLKGAAPEDKERLERTIHQCTEKLKAIESSAAELNSVKLVPNKAPASQPADKKSANKPA